MKPSRPPLSFLLVEQACLPNSLSASYSHLLDQHLKAVWNPDLSEYYNNQSLLDYALDQRLAYSVSSKSWEKNAGADPAMDQLWAKWVRLNPVNEELSISRAKKLIQAGSSLALEELFNQHPELGKHLKDLDIKAKHFPESFEKYVIGNNLIYTTKICLLQDPNFFSPERFELSSIASASMLKVLAEGKVLNQFSSKKIQDFKRNLGGGKLSAQNQFELYQMAEIYFPHWGKREEQMDVIASKLESKSQALLQLEMKHFSWRPGDAEMHSPLKLWALYHLNKQGSVEKGLMHLKDYPNYGKRAVQDQWSDAAWGWLGLMSIDQKEAFSHAQIAEDLSISSYVDQIKTFGLFLEQQFSPPQQLNVAHLVCELLRKLYSSPEELNQVWKELFEKSGSSELGWLFDTLEPMGAEKLVSALSLGYAYDGKGISDISWASWMSTALWTCIQLPKDFDIKYLSIMMGEEWNKGVRPLEQHQVWLNENVNALQHVPWMKAKVEQWILTNLQAPKLSSKPHFRL